MPRLSQTDATRIVRFLEKSLRAPELNRQDPDVAALAEVLARLRSRLEQTPAEMALRRADAHARRGSHRSLDR